MSRKKLSKEEILALLNQESQESDSEDDFEELYSPEELQQAQEEQEQVQLGWMNQAGDNSDNDEIEENQVENGDNFDNHVENVSREEHAYDRRTRVVNSIDSALDSDNFDKFKLPTNLKKYSVKVKPEVRVEGKVDWVNKPPKRSGISFSCFFALAGSYRQQQHCTFRRSCLASSSRKRGSLDPLIYHYCRHNSLVDV